MGRRRDESVRHRQSDQEQKFYSHGKGILEGKQALGKKKHGKMDLGIGRTSTAKKGVRKMRGGTSPTKGDGDNSGEEGWQVEPRTLKTGAHSLTKISQGRGVRS